MPKRARIHFVSLRSSLVNLPISIYGPLVERSVRPQHLAIHLTLVGASSKAPNNGPLEVYLGWTGMASASSLAHFNAGQSQEDGGFETIEMDPQYAQGLGLAMGDIVEIGLLHDLPHAKMISTEPLTSDDWEIIEIHASHVESTLLSQVRVAKVGQEIDVWVLGRTRVRLRVTSVDPPAKNNALLLTTNTEVSIAPKLHKAKKAKDASQPVAKQLNGSGKLSAKEERETSSTSTTTTTQMLRILPTRLFPSWGYSSYDGTELLAGVSARTLAGLMETEHYLLDLTKPRFYPGHFHRLSPPLDPSPSINPAPAPETTTRVLNPGSSKESTEPASGQPSADEIYVGLFHDVPHNHIVFSALPEGVEDWDLVLAEFLAGVDDILDRCTRFCINEFTLHSQTKSVQGLSGLLVTGRSGAGKTSIVRTVSKTLQADTRTLTYVQYIDASKFAEQPVLSVKAQFNYWFDKCSWHKPSLLVIDNLDKLLCAEVEHANSFRSRHLTELFIRIFSSNARTMARNSRGVMLMATAESTKSLHSLVTSSHIFKEVVHVTPPNKAARQEILSRLVEIRLQNAIDITQKSDEPLNFTELALCTEGYSATDLKDLVARAFHQLAVRATANSIPMELTHADFAAAQVDFTPLSLRDVKLEKSDVAWSDIGGLYETRRVLRETLEWPTKYGPIFKQSPLRLRSGLLLYGYPGCGKTLLASAVAKECGLNFISVKGPEILNKYIGASEKSVRDLFERASAAKPCVLFFDEFDSIAPKRGHDSTGVTDRVVNQMLTQMDGAEGLDGVYVLAATSRPDLIDSALLRPGRLDKSLLCNVPDFEERKDILKAVSKKIRLAASVDLDYVASKTDGFSGADLQALLYNAHLDAIHASIAGVTLESKTSEIDQSSPVRYTIIGASGSRKGKGKEGDTGKTVMSRAEEMALERRLRQVMHNSTAQRSVVSPEGKTKDDSKPAEKSHTEVTQEFILNALKTTRPSISHEERLRLDRVYEEFVGRRSGGMPVPPDAGGVGHRVTLG
ncbi:P-loop containing nucleoside triphosphate hydrolase protein [Panaeolus papilionaceus]|nr:P-loop containing nucleoside triphosphate hydrolase protein [Panaeolus papilionaceus]